MKDDAVPLIDNNDNTGEIMTPHRIISLADAVFAIVMTILILDVKLPPSTEQVSSTEFLSLLLGQWANLEAYFFSFLILGVFWIIHHRQFHSIKKSDRKLLWINIIFLMFISLIPFSTALVGDYQAHRLPGIIFAINMFMVQVFLVLNWFYAHKNGLLEEGEEQQRSTKIQCRRSYVALSVFGIAVFLSFLDIRWGYLAYFTIPIINRWMESRTTC